MIGAVQLLSDCIYIYGKFLKIVVELMVEVVSTSQILIVHRRGTTYPHKEHPFIINHHVYSFIWCHLNFLRRNGSQKRCSTSHRLLEEHCISEIELPRYQPNVRIPLCPLNYI